MLRGLLAVHPRDGGGLRGSCISLNHLCVSLAPMVLGTEAQ